jgi:hypothetical protein
MTVIPAQTEKEAIRLYCGVGEDEWNTLPVEVGAFACISPVYGKTLATKAFNAVRLSPRTIAVIQDSGAFCDGPGQRLSFEAARMRQIEHALRCDYGDRITHRASYDVLIDEKWDISGLRHKKRWSEGEAWEACIETIRAAKYLASHRDGLNCIFSAQGINAVQYLACVQGILPYFQSGDILGLGGFCILGKMPRLMPVFRDIIHTIIPFLGSEHIERVHLWGCLYAPALGELLYLCDRYNIRLSVDSVYPSLRPVLGRWGYSAWADASYRFRRPPAGPALGRDRRIHVYLVRRWLRDFRTREARYYRWRAQRKQADLFGEEAEAMTPLSAGPFGRENNIASFYRNPLRQDRVV